MRVWLVAALFFLVGCTEDEASDGPENKEPADPPAGGDGDDGDDPAPAEPAAPSEPAAPAPKRDPVTWDITISGNDFVEGTITIQIGDTVRWTHEDGTTPHTVTADDDSFHSGDCPGPDCMTQALNDEFEETFETIGDFAYHCQVHPSMTDTITVLERWDESP